MVNRRKMLTCSAICQRGATRSPLLKPELEIEPSVRLSSKSMARKLDMNLLLFRGVGATIHRSENVGSPQPNPGTTYPFNISGGANERA
jgi:hypothetical protein